MRNSWGQSESASGPAGLLDLFEDLEQQAAGLGLETRDDEVKELGAAVYTSVDLASRLHATVGAEVRIWLLSGHVLNGRLTRAGVDFALVDDAVGSWLVSSIAIVRLEGLSDRAVPEQARRASARLSLTAMLRRLAEGRLLCVVQLIGGQRLEGRVHRVGQDFFELVVPGADLTSAVPVAAVATLRGQR